MRVDGTELRSAKAAWHAYAAVLLAIVAGCSAGETSSPASRPERATPPAESSSEASAGPAAAEPAAAGADDALVQYSMITALAAGDYDGGIPLRSLLGEGDFGIGTFDRLDGELILLDGKVFQALAGGEVRPADLEGGSPFAAVTFFDADGQIENLSAATLDDLDQQLDRKLPRRNAPYALRIDGDFASLTLRSVPAQTPPFQPLVDVVKHQSTWRREDVRGSLVGLYYPPWIGTLNVAGYHWHFLSDDQTVGGHVLDCQFEQATLRYDECTSLVIRIPTSDTFERLRPGDVGHEEIDQIERQRSASDEG